MILGCGTAVASDLYIIDDWALLEHTNRPHTSWQQMIRQNYDPYFTLVWTAL